MPCPTLKFGVPLAIASAIGGVDFDQKYSVLHLDICTKAVEVGNVQSWVMGDTPNSVAKAQWLPTPPKQQLANLSRVHGIRPEAFGRGADS